MAVEAGKAHSHANFGIRTRANFFKFEPRPEDIFKDRKRELRVQMELLGIKLLSDSKVSITYLIPDERWKTMKPEEQSQAIKAIIELRSKRRMSDKRKEQLLSIALPLKKRVAIYQDLQSALRASKDHIIEGKLEQSLKIYWLVDKIQRINTRINEKKGRLSLVESNAKIRALYEIKETLERRNIVFPVDPFSEQAKERIQKAIMLFEEKKWYIACPQLYSAFTMLLKKLNQYERVADKSFRRADLLEEFIKMRQELIDHARSELTEINLELAESASIKEKRIAKLKKAIRLLNNDSKWQEVENVAKMFKTTRSDELQKARAHLLAALQPCENETAHIYYALAILSNLLEKTEKDGVMPISLKSNIHNRIADLSLSFRDSNEKVFVDISKELDAMKELVLSGNPNEALKSAARAEKLLTKAEELAGEKK